MNLDDYFLKKKKNSDDYSVTIFTSFFVNFILCESVLPFDNKLLIANSHVLK